nr:hypothetical protein [Micromonospora globispora]
MAGDQPPMPAKDRGWGDEPMGLQRPWQEPDQGGERCAVGPVQARLGVLSAQDRVLVTQDENLRVLGCGGPSEQGHPAGDPAEHEVDQAERHPNDGVRPARHDVHIATTKKTNKPGTKKTKTANPRPRRTG